MKELISRIKGAVGDKIVAIVIAKFLTPENILQVLSYGIYKLREACKDNGVTWDETAIETIEKALNIPKYVEK